MSWQLACAFDEIKDGNMKCLTLNDIDILVIGGETTAYAIPPMCPHMEEPLEHGMCDGKMLTCIKHLWQWELDNGNPIGEAETGLLKYETKIDGNGDVHVHVTEELQYEWSDD